MADITKRKVLRPSFSESLCGVTGDVRYGSFLTEGTEFS